MDPFDEFEFKPLTEGLGFHQKSEKLRERVKNSRVIEKEIAPIVPPRPSALFEDLPKIDQPSASHLFSDISSDVKPQVTRRKIQRKQFDRSPSRRIQEPQTSNIFDRNRIKAKDVSVQDFPSVFKEEVQQKTQQGSHQSPRRTLKQIPFSFMAACLDGVIIGAIALMFLSSLLFVAELSLATILDHVQVDSMTQVSLILLVFAVIEMYMVISRSFYGNSLGEWAFDIQLGDELQQKSVSYPFKVVARTLVNAATGFVMLPLISAVIRRDLAGWICRLPLFSY